jgi:hypothetical protein
MAFPDELLHSVAQISRQDITSHPTARPQLDQLSAALLPAVKFHPQILA